jgi:hypothetical protein
MTRLIRRGIELVDRLRRGGVWTELSSDPGHRPEHTIALYHSLRRNGIRVKYRVIGIGGGPGTPIGSVGQSISILVHRDDFHRAQHVRDAESRHL